MKKAHLISDFRKKISPQLGLEPTKMRQDLEKSVPAKICMLCIALLPTLWENENERQKTEQVTTLLPRAGGSCFEAKKMKKKIC